MSAAATLPSTQAETDATGASGESTSYAAAESPDEATARWLPFLALPDDA